MSRKVQISVNASALPRKLRVSSGFYNFFLPCCGKIILEQRSSDESDIWTPFLFCLHGIVPVHTGVRRRSGGGISDELSRSWFFVSERRGYGCSRCQGYGRLYWCDGRNVQADEGGRLSHGRRKRQFPRMYGHVSAVLSFPGNAGRRTGQTLYGDAGVSGRCVRYGRHEVVRFQLCQQGKGSAPFHSDADAER